MIIRRRSKPLVLKKLEMVSLRLSENFPRLQEIQQEIAIRNKGYIGEKKVDYHLEVLAPQFTIIQDVCLKAQGRSFQIDTIIMTNHAIFCIESKNFDGTITFNTILKQFTRNDGITETGYRYPITQVETQRHLLRNWLREHNFHNIPIYSFIAISQPSTIMNVIGDQESIAKVVAHAEAVPQMIIHSNDKIKGNASIRSQQIGQAILHKCMEHDFDILQKHGIKETHILPGVSCPTCQHLGMERDHTYWKCPKCNHKSKNAHLSTIAAYLHLIKPWITNKECMRFLKINSRNLATRLLKSANLTYDPKKRRWTK